MKASKALEIIKSVNQNPDIKWFVKSGIENVIFEITNSYAEDDASFRIERIADGDLKVSCHSTWESSTICYLIKGSEFFADFEDEEEGVRQALINLVGNFYYCW